MKSANKEKVITNPKSAKAIGLTKPYLSTAAPTNGDIKASVSVVARTPNEACVLDHPNSSIQLAKNTPWV